MAATLFAALASTSPAATIYGLTDDRLIESNGTLDDIDLMWVGKYGAGYGNDSAVFAFQLPTLPVGQKFDTVSFSVYHTSKWGTPTFNLDLYGLEPRSSATVLTSDLYGGTLDPNADNTRLVDNFLTPSTPNAGYVTTSSTTLLDYLTDAYDYGLNAGRYIFFRLSPDTAAYDYSIKAYIVGSAEYMAPSNSYKPKLTYTTSTIGTPGWSAVPLGGGGFVTGLVADSTGNDIYCRTDVGGAFKWNAATGQWNSISDAMVPTTTTTGASGLMPVSALAVDPGNSNNIYAACGTQNGGLKDIYASTNKGATWTATNSGIYINASVGDRGYGERMAVDPNNSNILWFGSVQAGLQKGVKGSTWGWTQIPNTSVPFGGAIGVISVVCDRNGTGPTIVYAGVSDPTGTTGGIYQSIDAGTTWTKVGGATINAPHEARLAPNGTLYVTAGTDGVFKMPRGGTLSQITSLPAGVIYHGVTVDQTDATGNTVFVSEFTTNYYNKIYRSTNGGATWATQSQTFNNLTTGAVQKTEPDGTPSCAGAWFENVASILVNPTNGSELWTGDFFGVSRTQDAQNLGQGTTGCYWYGLQKGQEETVVLSLKNAPSGLRLVRGQGDLNGHYYLDNYARPVGNAGGPTIYPNGKNTTSIDFCESNPAIWARTWVDTGAGSGGISTDGGVNWMPFGCIDHHLVTNSTTAGTETWDMTAFVANQKAKGVTAVTLVLVAPDIGSSVQNLSFDSKEGTVAPQLIVNGSTSATLQADSYVSNLSGALATNYGTSPTLTISGAYGSFKRWIYVRFDLSALSTVTSAVLQMNRRAVTGNTTTFDVGVYACANLTWVEGNGGTDNVPANEITWNNHPATVASPGDPITQPNYGSLRGGRIAVSATNPNNMVWMGMQASAAYYSKDRGVTWSLSTGGPGSQMGSSPFAPSSCINQLTSDRVNGDFYIAKFGVGSQHTIYRSTNGGATWTQCGIIGGRTSQTLPQLVCAPGVAGDVWLADGSPTSGLWHSTNFGATFTRLNSNKIISARCIGFGMPPAGNALPYSLYIDCIFYDYVSNKHTVLRSDDACATLINLGTPTLQDADCITGDRQVPGRVFLGTAGRGAFQFQ